MSEAEHYPDKTLAELRDDPEFDLEKEGFIESDDMQDEIEELHEIFEIMATAITLGRLVDDNKITVREYIELVEHLEDYERENDVTIL